jgi:hypothetical protein
MTRTGFEHTILVLKTAHVSCYAAPEISTELEAAQHNTSKYSGNYIYRYVNSKVPKAISNARTHYHTILLRHITSSL